MFSSICSNDEDISCCCCISSSDFEEHRLKKPKRSVIDDKNTNKQEKKTKVGTSCQISNEDSSMEAIKMTTRDMGHGDWARLDPPLGFGFDHSFRGDQRRGSVKRETTRLPRRRGFTGSGYNPSKRLRVECGSRPLRGLRWAWSRSGHSGMSQKY